MEAMPGETATHLQAVKILESLAAHPERAHPAIRIHALEVLGVLGVNGQIGRAGFGVIVEKVLPPQGHLVKHGILRPEELLPGQIIIVPVHHHLAASHIVGSRGAHSGKKSALHRAGNNKRLTLFHGGPLQ